jgi:Protein of unknown function (DUF3017)
VPNGSRTEPAPPARRRSPRRNGGARLGHFAYGLVIAGVLGGLLWIWQSAQNVRGGTLTVAGAMFAAALARQLLPQESVRLLSSRRRLLDTAAFSTLGLALLIAGLIVPVPS